MSDLTRKIHELSPKRLALLALELEDRLEAAEGRATGPIAIVGLGCRFPGGATSPDAFWRLLDAGVDAIREVPPDRWDINRYYDPDPDAPGRMSTRWGGFLDECDRFDPDFFGISPREAQSMDPQQRLLLEVTWEALEDAGIAPDGLHGSAAGVFVGICNSDYGQVLMGRGPDAIDAYLASGNAFSVASGRLSYVLGLQGPSVAVDTACSSSLVAVHLACQSLRAGECRVALAAGVNLILAPETTIALSKAHMMAPDGRCKTFDASADGFVRGEGCGVVVLKRLADAEADGDRVLAVIRGSAINQDGRSSGLTAPNGPSQEAVIRAALGMAGLAPADVDYVEAHGTGTSLGDPIEVRALGAALGAGRVADRPLRIGSVKTNIGHLESAAGIAGLIKAVLALRQERIPPHLHFSTPNPHIEWASLPVAVTTEAVTWARGDRRRVAGVSSFGFSGTNAHIVIEEASVGDARAAGETAEPRVLVLSTRSDETLREQAGRVAAHLRRAREAFADACWTLNTGRARLPQRLALTASTADEAAGLLEAFAAGQAPKALVTGEAPADAAEVTFLFTGQGAQYADMGRGLYERELVFRSAVDRVGAALDGALEQPLVDVLYGAADAQARIDETAFTQPALFAVEYALAELWRAWGLTPSVVMGHSVGEFAAACVAGVMEPEDAARLIAARGRLMQAQPAGGRMAAVFAPVETVEPLVAARAEAVAIAAVNGPEHVVISGEGEAVAAILAALAGRGVRSQPLTVSHAFHSPLMAPMVEAFRAEAASIRFRAPRIGFVSNLTGQVLPVGQVPDADYWCRHVMAPVQFARSIEACLEAGHRLCLEVGPAPTLIGMARRIPGAEAADWVPSLRKGRDDHAQMIAGVAELFVHGAPVDWRGVEGGAARRRVSLPTSPFRRRRCWVPVTSGPRQASRPAAASAGHPLIGVRLDGPLPVWDTTFDSRVMPWLGDHRVHGTIVVPGPVCLEMMRAAADEVLRPEADSSGTRPVTLEDLALREPLVVAPARPMRVQTIVTATGPDAVTVQVFSAPGEAERAGTGDAGEPVRWTLHASAVARADSRTAAPDGIDPAAVQARAIARIDGATFYAGVRARGIEVGGGAEPVRELWRGDDEALAELSLPEAALASEAFALHPMVLDAAMLTLGAAVPESGDSASPDTEGAGTGTTAMLAGIGRAWIGGVATSRMTSHVRVHGKAADGGLVADIQVGDAIGRLVARLEGVRIVRRAASWASATAAGAAGIDPLLYDVAWHADGPVDSEVPPARFLPPFEVLTEAAEARATSLAREHGLAAFDDVVPVLDRACAAWAWRAFQALGANLTPGARVGAAALADRLGVLPRHRRLVAAMVAMLEADGVLARGADGFTVTGAAVADDPGALCAGLEASRPAFAAQARLLAACGGQLAGVLRGTVDPLHLLFPDGSFAPTEALYQHGPFARAFNALAAGVVRAVAASVPAGRRLRCLEVGAGTGGTSAAVLPVLPPDAATYTYTDLSPLFLARAKAKFQAFGFVDYALLDIERDPRAQGFAAGGADVVIASNVLHATANLRETLAHARDLLAPGGLLLLLEGTEAQRWVDLTFGLLEGWWRFTDHDVRPSYPLLTQTAWTSLLREVGFDAVATVPRARAPQALVLARAPATAMSDRAAAVTGRTWMVAGTETAVGRAVVARLEAAGAVVHALAAPDRDRASAVARVLASGDAPVTVLHVAGGGDGTDDEVARVARDLAGLASTVRAVTDPSVPRARDVRLRIATCGAVVVNEADAGTGPNAREAAAWGLGRVIGLEHPERWGGLIDLDPRADAAANAGVLIAVVLATADGDGEDQVAVRDGVRYVPRIVRAAAIEAVAPTLRADATYLMTGGTGGLAAPVARWLVARGARHLLLTSRRGLPDRGTWAGVSASDPARRLIDLTVELEGQGARVEVAACDAGDLAAMRALIATRETAGVPPLRGVVHAAAAMSAVPVRDLDEETLLPMLRSKVGGGDVLDRLTRGMSLDLFVLFSSTTAVWGVAGLGHYAAANAWLDALAESRAAGGRPSLSIDWGTWEEMRLASAEDRRTFAQAGLRPMAAADALDRLGRLLGAGAHRKIVAGVDWATLKPLYEARRARPLFADVRPIDAATIPPRAASDGPTGADIVEALRAAAPDERRERLTAWVAAQAAEVLGLPASEPVPLGRGLFEMGMDSLMSVELKHRLEAGLSHPLPSTLTFNYPNVGAIVEFLSGELGLDPAAEVAPGPGPVGHAPSPAHADDLSEDELAQLLADRLRSLE